MEIFFDVPRISSSCVYVSTFTFTLLASVSEGGSKLNTKLKSKQPSPDCQVSSMWLVKQN